MASHKGWVHNSSHHVHTLIIGGWDSGCCLKWTTVLFETLVFWVVCEGGDLLKGPLYFRMREYHHPLVNLVFSVEVYWKKSFLPLGRKPM